MNSSVEGVHLAVTLSFRARSSKIELQYSDLSLFMQRRQTSVKCLEFQRKMVEKKIHCEASSYILTHWRSSYRCLCVGDNNHITQHQKLSQQSTLTNSSGLRTAFTIREFNPF